MAFPGVPRSLKGGPPPDVSLGHPPLSPAANGDPPSASHVPDAALAIAGPPPVAVPEKDDDNRAVRRLVFALAWPVIVEQLLQSALGFVDLLMVSRLGAAAIAGLGLSVQVLFIVIACISAIATGTTVLVAHFVGAGERGNAARCTKQSLLLGIALGVLIAVDGGVFATPLVSLLDPDPAVVALGSAYLRISCIAATALTLTLVLGAALRGAGDSRSPMLIALGVNAVNVVVAYTLIFGKFGFPALGVAGSAWGAALARTTGAVALLVVLLRGAGPAKLRLGGATTRERWDWRPDLRLCLRILRIGVPSMGEQLSRSLGMLLFAEVVISLGTTVFAAQRITFNIISLSFLPGFGFSIAATALTGQAMGAGRPERAQRATWFAVRSAALWQGAMGVLFLVAAPLFMRAFVDDPSSESAAMIVTLGAAGLRVLALGQPQTAIAQVLAGGLRGAGDTRFPLLVTSISIWLIRVPLAWFFTLRLGWGMPGAYLGFVLGATLEAIAIYLRYRTGSWRLLTV